MHQSNSLKKLQQKYPNKTAIITGANSGLGLALTQKLLDESWTILAIDLQTTTLHQIKNNLLHIFECDLRNSQKLEILLNNAIREHKIDIVFNNAGVGEGSIFEEYSLENWQWIMDINTLAVINVCRILIPHFKKNNSGMIINIASAAGFANLPNMSPYNVTKAAVISLSETLGYELSNTNIQVKCFTPTFFRSGIMTQSKGDQAIINSARKLIESAKTSSEEAANIILKNLTNKKEIIRFPYESMLLYWSKKWFPRLYSWAIKKYLVKNKEVN